MSFNNFCNICFIKENVIKLCREENESILDILISFTTCPDTVNGIIYLCINCCNKLEEFNQFRELFLTNFVRFRYLYSEYKKKLEISSAPDIDTQLKAFVDVNVERASGTPLIENYKVAHALRNNSTCNVDVKCKESDGELLKEELKNFNYKYDSVQPHTSFNSVYTTSEYETQICHVKSEQDSFKENQENVNENVLYVKGEPNPDQFEESQDPLANDTVVNFISCHESKHDDISYTSFKPEDCATDDTTNEEGSTDNENKTTKTDTICNVCDERFSCNSDLEEHIRTHTGEKLYNCDKCNKTFTDTTKLIKHKRFHTGNRPYKCDECGLSFTQRCNLNAHERIHTGEKPYKCDECGLGFAQQSNLKSHKRTHTGEKPYECEECGMGFTKIYSLKRHKGIHTRETPYKCDECGLEFIKQSNLMTHKRIHTGDKCHKCDECGLGFSRRDHLNIHKLRHTGEKPYKCEECDLRFRHTSSLRKHIRMHRRKTVQM